MEIDKLEGMLAMAHDEIEDYKDAIQELLRYIDIL